MQNSALSVKPSDDRLRRTLAEQRLSPLEAVRAGHGDAGDIARLATVLARDPRKRRASRTHTARRAGVLPATTGCEICRAPLASESLCRSCRDRMALPFVDAEAAREAALVYRVQRAARQAAERAEAQRAKDRPWREGTRASEDGADSASAPGGGYQIGRSAQGWLLLRRGDGTGYIIRPSGPGFIMTEWVNSAEVGTGKKRRFLVEEFLRELPEVSASPGCEEAIRMLAASGI
jgi:hypothetical protein